MASDLKKQRCVLQERINKISEYGVRVWSSSINFLRIPFAPSITVLHKLNTMWFCWWDKYRSPLSVVSILNGRKVHLLEPCARLWSFSSPSFLKLLFPFIYVQGKLCSLRLSGCEHLSYNSSFNQLAINYFRKNYKLCLLFTIGDGRCKSVLFSNHFLQSTFVTRLCFGHLLVKCIYS
jgi:hypothetical protein